MRQVKVYLPDTRCERCGAQVNRKRAEANDWIEIVYVDQTGMPITKSTVCNSCAENWTPDAFIPNVAVAPALADSPTPANDNATLPDAVSIRGNNDPNDNAYTLAELAAQVNP
jgi:hypothetical protein